MLTHFLTSKMILVLCRDAQNESLETTAACLLVACMWFSEQCQFIQWFFFSFLLTLIWQINQPSLNLFPLVLGLKASASTLIHLALPCKTIKEHCLDSTKRIAVSWGSVRVKLNPRWRVNPTPFSNVNEWLVLAAVWFSLSGLSSGSSESKSANKDWCSVSWVSNKTEEWLYSVLPFLSATTQYTVLSEICKMPNLDSVCRSGREKHRR